MAVDLGNIQITFQFQQGGGRDYRNPNGGAPIHMLPWAWWRPGNDGKVYLTTAPTLFLSNHADHGLSITGGPFPVAADCAAIYMETRQDNPFGTGQGADAPTQFSNL